MLGSKSPPSCDRVCVMLANTCTSLDTQKYGIVETDDHGVVVQFLEKPPPAATKSRKGVSSS